MAGLDRQPSCSPFVDEGTLTATGVADGMPERSDDLEALESILRPSRDGEAPVGVALYGPSGCGKTELVHQCAAGFERATGTAVHLECAADDTVFACCQRLANELGADLPDTGLALDTARKRVIDRLSTAPSPRCVVLDDLDRLDDDVRRELLVDVIGAVSDDAAVATIVTSQRLALRNDLDAVELATISDSERALAPYDRSDLKSIFDRRLQRAVREGSVGDDLVEGAVEAALDRGGDVGFGLELVAAACEIAESDCDLPVNRSHLVRARERVAVDDVVQLLDALRTHHVLALRGLCDLAASDELPARIGPAFDAYARACDAADEAPNTERSLQNYLRRLVEIDLVDSEEVRTESGGKFNRYELARAPELITAAFDERS
ncbi:Cdc6/Cdc18 family protein [Salinarchaeum laminariae]|uniref:Cdc6/Cdc18 family protein n=1 Tax=Salinarchaeum laminariae TaxID=869888 RepID=UPI0020BE3F2B|nr:AAA family ATPase [Salinarchaeum laminariae]